MTNQTKTNPYLVPATVRCAGPNCQKVKGETNHWFTVAPNTTTDGPYSSILTVWRGAQAVYELDSSFLPVCGEECLQKVISHILHTPRQEEAKQEAKDV